MSAIQDEIEETMRLANEQQALATGERLATEQAEDEQALFDRARQAQEAEVGGLPEKYRNKTAAEVYALMQKEIEYKAKKEPEPSEDDQEAPSEEAPVESTEEPEDEATVALREASEEFYKNEGKLDEETIKKLFQQ